MLCFFVLDGPSRLDPDVSYFFKNLLPDVGGAFWSEGFAGLLAVEESVSMSSDAGGVTPLYLSFSISVHFKVLTVSMAFCEELI